MSGATRFSFDPAEFADKRAPATGGAKGMVDSSSCRRSRHLTPVTAGRICARTLGPIIAALTTA
jgi:hypothetical protein